ncbi:hypothetical protein [Streptomyces montanisoli]|uniref:Uncharacterized protein n=1 Tax=Streptomyces montanisoli TaxID=2798581 RepID=A0A940MBK3_9ACTN|nr:hypothetical protein [Streptomyces montanisoli]MBP0457010.1 hypothetical protein [Streptomyces montanisoli]
MGTGEQIVTVVAVLLGALTTHLTNHLTQRGKVKYELLTRWDNRKLDAYSQFVDRVRTGIFLAVRLYEHREGLRLSDIPETELVADLAEAERFQGRSFEQIMLLGGDDVVEAAHELHAAVRAIDWQANGKVTGTLEEWRERNRVAFRAINTFHESARADLGVRGRVTGEQHPERDLLLPAARQDADAAGE